MEMRREELVFHASVRINFTNEVCFNEEKLQKESFDIMDFAPVSVERGHAKLNDRLVARTNESRNGCNDSNLMHLIRFSKALERHFL